MTIIASVPAPAGSRLIDADTADLTAIRKADNAGRFPALNSSHTARQASAPGGFADPIELGRQAYQLMYDHRAKTLPDLMAALHASEQTVLDGIRAFIKEQTGFDLGPADDTAAPAPTACPVWCTRDHTSEVTEYAGLIVGTQHERVLAELTGQDPTCTDAPAAAMVSVERYEEDGEVHPDRIVLAVTEGAEAQYPGSEGVQGWTGTPEQAEALAAALIEAARIARTAR